MKSRPITSVLVLTLALAGTGAGVRAAPAGDDAFREYCVACHQLKLPAENGRTCEKWKTTVARMSAHRERLRIAAIPEESQIVIAQYLASQVVPQ